MASLSADLASVRYRALLPLLALEMLDCEGVLFQGSDPVDLDGLDALVIVKTFTLNTLLITQEASARGIPVLIDICDNIFIETYGKKGKNKFSDMFLAVAAHASAIVAPTEPLAEVIRQHVPATVPVHVIPDGIETRESLLAGSERMKRATEKAGPATLSQEAASPLAFSPRDLLRPRTFLKAMAKRIAALRPTTRLPARIPSPAPPATPRKPGALLPILWFGNHGAEHASFGMLDLIEIQTELEAIAAEFPIELVVVSNNLQKYQQYIAPMAIPSRYIEWSSDVVEECLSQAAVVVIPNTLDAFSRCKSANRSVHALMRGVPVVATATPALAPLADCIVLDDFTTGLRRYLSDAANGRADASRARAIIEQAFGSQALGRAWHDLLDSVIESAAANKASNSADLVIALNLIQDLDLVLPIALAARGRGAKVQLWSSVSLLKKSPRVISGSRAYGFSMKAVPDDVVPAFPEHVKALITAAETNLNPHRFTRQLTECAKRLGILTATLQHGLENVGLTYSDSVHTITKVDIAADRIYLWGELTSLHADTSEETRGKCIPTGCPKPAKPPPVAITPLIADDAVVIGIFENLHWHRYSDDYRRFFLEGVTSLAESFPDITFLVKPHHAGMWLTSRYKGDKPAAPNLVIADPNTYAWESHTASGLLGRLTAVITTPSTVALDAARYDLPVSVVAHTLDLPRYEPLHHIARASDWHAFVAGALDPGHRPELIAASGIFVGRAILEGDAATRIVDDLLV